MNAARKFALVFLLCLAGSPLASAQQRADQLTGQSLQEIATEVETKGDAKQGAIVFYRDGLSCWRCHDSVSGRRLGPHLAEVREVTVEHLIESVLKPSAKIREGFEQQIFQLDDGRVVSGIVVSEDDSKILLDRIEEPGKPLEIETEAVENRRRSPESSMPVGLVNQLTQRQEFIDLIAYLKVIADQGPGKAVQLKPANAGQTLPLPAYESDLDHRQLISLLDENVLKQGEEIFRLQCASCHGDLTHEGSMPTSLRFASGKFKHGGDPLTMYQTVTHGFGLMMPQRTLVPQQKYAVIHYIRETFVKPHNPEQYVAVDEAFLRTVPTGSSIGPTPEMGQPWVKMDYGPSFINTIEVPHLTSKPNKNQPQNIAQKGIVVRLDSGIGGVSAGHDWFMFDHDTMRMSAIWSGEFIDYNGIHFNGVHGRHPKVAGQVIFENSDGPGWSDPANGQFDDNQRVEGRDGLKYGPLPKSWAEYHGMYRHAEHTVISYSVNNVPVLESPTLQRSKMTSAVVRNFEIDASTHPLVMQVADANANSSIEDGICRLRSDRLQDSEPTAFDGQRFFEIAKGDQQFESGYSIQARIKTKSDGTLVSFTRNQSEWLPNGQSFFIRDGRLAFDIGWVGAIAGSQQVDDGNWHDVALNWDSQSGFVELSVDGKIDRSGTLKVKEALTDSVIRVGFTNQNFPQQSAFSGQMESVSVQDLSKDNAPKKAAADSSLNSSLNWTAGKWESQNWKEKTEGMPAKQMGFRFIACLDSKNQILDWLEMEDGQVRLRIPAGETPRSLRVILAVCENELDDDQIQTQLQSTSVLNLKDWTHGGPRNWPETITTTITEDPPSGGFITDTLQLPVNNPWNCRLRLSGIDFIPDSNDAIVCAWDGSVWKVEGIGNSAGSSITWRRIAAGLFQPLGVKLRNGVIFVTCRDQLVALRDLNDDGEMDWYECFNNDHQVTPHFHEFAMGLQTDDEGNFYYAKSARHALKAVVPHHGTLLKINADGSQTEILANGFRAANGVCLNPDGSFVVTDQEGHWNPKNRINWVRPGEFYGNMFGYHDVTDESDEAMTPPLCWITNDFDRSPAELLWIDSKKWGALNGHLMNLSYGYGKAYIVPLEEVGGQMQGGMCAFDIPSFPTGIMRGRFRPADGELYCCGLFAWSSTQETPGGLYRLRATGMPFHLPVELHAHEKSISIQFSETLAPESIQTANFAVRTWDLKRTANYGSNHYNEKDLKITSVKLGEDHRTVTLTLPNLKPTWGMEIAFGLKDSQGNWFENKIHNSIYNMSHDDN